MPDFKASANIPKSKFVESLISSGSIKGQEAFSVEAINVRFENTESGVRSSPQYKYLWFHSCFSISSSQHLSARSMANKYQRAPATWDINWLGDQKKVQGGVFCISISGKTTKTPTYMTCKHIEKEIESSSSPCCLSEKARSSSYFSVEWNNPYKSWHILTEYYILQKVLCHQCNWTFHLRYDNQNYHLKWNSAQKLNFSNLHLK